MLRIRCRALSVHAHRPILAGETVRFEEQVEVDVVRERRECRPRQFPRQFRYLVEFR